VTRDIDAQLTKYLTDAHSIEEQALAQLRSAPDLAGTPELAEAFRAHLRETESHEQAIRRLLDARGASPSRVKDTVMKLGGLGFLLFAKLQPDTPGKLLAHATSYEALEQAAYELLHGVAQRADDGEVCREATRIRNEERAMRERLESLTEASVEASLRDLSPSDLREQLAKYLSDAHAIEEQAITLLERGPGLVGHDELGRAFEDHLVETREHAELVTERLRALDGSTNRLKDAAMRLGALQWGLFFKAHPDTPGKLIAFAYAFEHLEIGGYEQLRVVARRAGDEETVAMATRILDQERAAADRLSELFDLAAAASLEAVGVPAGEARQ
jgi:ferritin-like metal-binding protein YciE